MPTTLTYDELHARALTRARAEALVVMQISPNRYSVPSRAVKPGEWRYVHLLADGALTCDCEGFWAYRCCTHSASVELALAERLPLFRAPGLPSAPINDHLCPRCRRAPVRQPVGLCRDCEIDALYPD